MWWTKYTSSMDLHHQGPVHLKKRKSPEGEGCRDSERDSGFKDKLLTSPTEPAELFYNSVSRRKSAAASETCKTPKAGSWWVLSIYVSDQSGSLAVKWQEQVSVLNTYLNFTTKKLKQVMALLKVKVLQRRIVCPEHHCLSPWPCPQMSPPSLQHLFQLVG